MIHFSGHWHGVCIFNDNTDMAKWRASLAHWRDYKITADWEISVSSMHCTSFAPEIAAYYARISCLNPVPFRTGCIQYEEQWRPSHRARRARKPQKIHLPRCRVERRQFGVEQRFHVENLGAEPVFSEFRVTNPESKNSYRVAIRGSDLGANFCSCPDFATNALGTCKHVEFTLASLTRRRGGKAAL